MRILAFEVGTEVEGESRLQALELRSGCLGGRVLPPNQSRSWRVQVFYRDHEENGGTRAYLPTIARHGVMGSSYLEQDR